MGSFVGHDVLHFRQTALHGIEKIHITVAIDIVAQDMINICFVLCPVLIRDGLIGVVAVNLWFWENFSGIWVFLIR